MIESVACNAKEGVVMCHKLGGRVSALTKNFEVDLTRPQMQPAHGQRPQSRQREYSALLKNVVFGSKTRPQTEPEHGQRPQ